MPERAGQQGSNATESATKKPPEKPIPETETVEPESREAARAVGVAYQPPASPPPDKPASTSATKISRRPALTGKQALALQRTVGNHAAREIMRSLAQRVPVSASTSETLYNDTNSTTGEASARRYGGPKTYDITRQGDAGATVTVKIKYLNQARNTTPPGPNPPPGTPRLGQLIGSPTEIPATDVRRAWARDMSQQAVAHWNGQVTFVGEETNLLSENTTKRLPVSFRAEPVFDMGAEAHSTVIVHGPATTAGTPGHPIDAGNFYMNKNDRYPASDDIIYAHEYGHLIGIPDEYSQSNEQMNALLHQASPGNAAASLAALDQETIERMALTAMRRPLYDQLMAAMPTFTAAVQAQGATVRRQMAQAARAAVVTPAVRDQLQNRLMAEADPTLGPDVPRAVAFQTTTNFSNISRAAEGVQAAFDPGALGNQIGDLYWRALSAPLSETVRVQGLDDVAIRVHNSVTRTTGAGGYNAGDAGAVATDTVGPAAAAGPVAGGGPPGLPVMPPPGSLVGQISALPSAWSAAGSALESGVTAEAFAAKLQSILPSAAAAAAEAILAMVTGGAATPAIARRRELYQRAHALINNAAREAATQLASELIRSQVEPVIQASVTAFQSALESEAANIMTKSPAELAALGDPNPAMRALVSDMKRRLDIDKQRTAGTGRDPLGAGVTAADQDVTYSAQGLMGSNQSTDVRADQFRPMVNQFNEHFKGFWEQPFTVETR